MSPADPDGGSSGVNRRGFLTGATIASAFPFARSFAQEANVAASNGPDPRAPVDLTLRVNGQDHRLSLDPRTALLDALRERLGLTGSKKGCDHGQCGACTVLIDGKRMLSCLTLAAAAEGRDITTIEGLSRIEGPLHPMQQAFIDQDGFQCGYCTPGQIMSAIGCVNEGHAGSPDEIREFMSGNLCRCGAYPNIVAAIEQAKMLMKGA